VGRGETVGIVHLVVEPGSGDRPGAATEGREGGRRGPDRSAPRLARKHHVSLRFLPRRGSLLLAVALTALTLLPTAPAADAHPFGPPQTVTVEAHEDVVHIRWKVGGADDLVLLGVALGVLPEDRVMLDGATFFEEADAALLTESAALGAYLTDHITVTSGEQPCSGQVTTVDDLVDGGVELVYACAGVVTDATVRVDTLTDLDDDYRTFATGPGQQRAMYTAADVSHDWALGDAARSGDDLGTSAAVQLGLVVGVVITVVGLLWLRRRARRA